MVAEADMAAVMAAVRAAQAVKGDERAEMAGVEKGGSLGGAEDWVAPAVGKAVG